MASLRRPRIFTGEVCRVMAEASKDRDSYDTRPPKTARVSGEAYLRFSVQGQGVIAEVGVEKTLPPGKASNSRVRVPSTENIYRDHRGFSSGRRHRSPWFFRRREDVIPPHGDWECNCPRAEVRCVVHSERISYSFAPRDERADVLRVLVQVLFLAYNDWPIVSRLS